MQLPAEWVSRHRKYTGFTFSFEKSAYGTKKTELALFPRASQGVVF